MYLLPLSMINEVNHGFMDDVSQHNRNSTTVPLTRFSHNAEFRNSQNARYAGTRCTKEFDFMINLTPRYLLPLSMINEVNRGFMDDVSQHNLSHVYFL